MLRGAWLDALGSRLREIVGPCRLVLQGGPVLTPADMAGRETLLAPPLLRLGRRLGLAPGETPISLAPPLASLVGSMFCSMQAASGSARCTARGEGLLLHAT